jgi:hypothetical protein
VTPTVFGPDRIKADVAADLALRGVTGVEFLVGEWNTERFYGATRVVIGIGKAQVQSAADTMHSTDGWIDVGGGQVAQAHLARVHTFPIWVHGYAPPYTAPDQVPEVARSTTLALLDQVCAAVRRTRGGLPMLPWAVEAYSEERGDFVDGSVQRVDVQIAVPIFDDPSDVGTAEEMNGDAQLEVDDIDTPEPPEDVPAP